MPFGYCSFGDTTGGTRGDHACHRRVCESASRWLDFRCSRLMIWETLTDSNRRNTFSVQRHSLRPNTTIWPSIRSAGVHVSGDLLQVADDSALQQYPWAGSRFGRPPRIWSEATLNASQGSRPCACLGGSCALPVRPSTAHECALPVRSHVSGNGRRRCCISLGRLCADARPGARSPSVAPLGSMTLWVAVPTETARSSGFPRVTRVGCRLSKSHRLPASCI